MICLQGGREFTSACVEMDRWVLEDAATPRVAILAGAARVGRDYDGAVARATRHYRALGADVVGVPDPRQHPMSRVRRALDGAGLLVLPGGSPGSLRGVLRGEVEALVRARLSEGMTISGASAGAMVLCSLMWEPASGSVRDGLGIVPGMALVHWSGRPATSASPDAPRWGLPECGGVLVRDGRVRAVGAGEPSLSTGQGWIALPRHRWAALPGAA